MRRAIVVVALACVAAAAGTAAAVARSGDASALERCVENYPGPAARACYVDALLAETAAPDELVELAGRLLASDDPRLTAHFLRECHEVFHDIGERFGTEGRLLDYSRVPFESCTFGVVHGANDVRLMALRPEELLDLPTDWCAEGRRATHGLDGFKHSCLHGIGHAAMEHALGTSGIDAARVYVRDVCRYDAADVSEVDRAYFEFHCLDGAYMQWALDAVRVDRSLATDDPFGVCRGLITWDPPSAQACYRQVVPLVLDGLVDLAQAVPVCEAEGALVDEVYVRHCIRSVSANAMWFTSDWTNAARTTCPAAADRVTCVAEFDRSESYDTGPDHRPYGTTCAAVLVEPADVRRCTEWASGPIELLGVTGTDPAS